MTAATAHRSLEHRNSPSILRAAPPGLGPGKQGGISCRHRPPISNFWPSTRSAPWRWMPSRRPTAAIRARRWPWPRWPMRSGSMCCDTIRTLRIWPGRDRFVLSCGHASMLLYSLLHLAGVKQVDDAGRPTGELAVPLDQIKRFRQLHSRCPGHPEARDTSGVETTTGPLGQGLRQQRRHGDRPALAGGSFQSAGLRSVRLQRLRVVQRRRHDGRRGQRSRLDRRASEALEPVLDLRRQSHHDRGQHRAGLRRRRRHAIHRARLARDPRGRRQRPRSLGMRPIKSFARPTIGRR